MIADSSEIERLTQALAGRYAIERELGRGGMATVYLARDVKHERRVAVKVLHPDLAAALGAERFLTEIRTTANLQHPHILPLHDSGDAGGYLFYVMPFVEGETLRARIERERQLPIDDAIRMTREVLSALDYAHRHGVIHRDVKPENVLLHDRSALVADFGIALAVQSASGARMTQTGLSLGTPSYMSPEQAMGEKSIDGRADIYAAGAMLYEMLTGEPPFSGATVQAIIAKVLTERPTPPSIVRDTVPPGIEQAVLKALAKLPADRFAGAAQFADALAQGSSHVMPSFTSARQSDAARNRSRVLAAALGVALVALAATSTFAWRWFSRPAPATVAFEFAAELANPNSGLAVSHDGRRIALIVVSDSGPTRQRRIAIREIGKTELIVIPATNAGVLGWSPDDREIIYGAGRYLFRVATNAGAVPRRVSTDSLAGIFGDPSWGADDQILFSDGGRTAVVSAAGGKVRHIYADSLKIPQQTMPRFLPDGRRFLFTTGFRSGGPGIWLGTLDGAPPREILPIFSRAMVANGHLFFVKDDELLAHPIDERTGTLSGEPHRLADRAGSSARSGEAPFDVSPVGTLVYRQGTASMEQQPVWVDRSTGTRRPVGGPLDAVEMNLSPDGRFVAFSGFSGDVWAMNLQTGILTRVTADSSSNSPIWMPDSRTLVYQYRPATSGVSTFRRRMVGGALDTLVYDGSPISRGLVEDVSPDGSTLIFRTPDGLFALPMKGRTPTPLIARPAIAQARFSPDGRWVSFNSRETGSTEVYVATYPKFDRVMRVSVAGGVEARWRADSRELFYLTLDGKVMSVAVNPQSADPFAAPVELLKSPVAAPTMSNDEWSVSGDGQRFLFLAPVDGKKDAPRPLTVILNWRSGNGS